MGDTSAASARRRPFGPSGRFILLGLCWASLMSATAWAQAPSAGKPSVRAVAAEEETQLPEMAAMRAWAQRVLTESPNPEASTTPSPQGPGNAARGVDWLNRMRLQLVAEDASGALDSLRRLREDQMRQGQAEPQLSYLNYEIYARALRLSQAEGSAGFAAAFNSTYTQVLHALSDLQAMRVERSFAYNLERGEQDWRTQLKAAPLDASVHLTQEQIKARVRAYQPWLVFRSVLPLMPPLLQAEEERRYLREQAQVRGPDGATLSAFVMRPRNAPARLPATLVFSIYADEQDLWRQARNAAQRGYVGVAAYSRGKAGSPDAIAPYEFEHRDVNAVIDWMARQPWSDGRVGMFGGSYDGFAQWAALKRPHPALKTIVPYVAAMPGQGLPMENNVGLNANYGWAFYVGNHAYLDKTSYFDSQRWNRLADRWYESGRPHRDIDQIDGQANPWLQRWLQHPSYDGYWQSMVPQGRDYARIDIPVLSITGYYDDGQISALEYLRQHETHHPRPNHVLLIGPYDHGGAQSSFKAPVLRGYAIDPVAQFDTQELTFQWLDHQLKGGPRPALLKDRVNYQVMGTNRWLHAPSLNALHRQNQRLYLSPSADGRSTELTPDRRQRAHGFEQTLDLADRQHSSNTDYYPAPILRRELDTSSGYTFVSAPLKQAMNLAGRFSGELHLVINKRDVDLGLVLYELTAQGDYLHLSYFLGRASHARDMSQRRLLTPGRVQRIPFERTRMVARHLQAGSRLVLQVNVNKNSGAQVNHGTGKPVSEESAADAGEPLHIRWLSSSFIQLPMSKPLQPEDEGSTASSR